MNIKGIYKKNLFKSLIVYTTSITIVLSSCDEFVDVDTPTTQITKTDVYENDAVATAAIRGIYSKMTEGTLSFAVGSSSLYGGWLSDELSIFSSNIFDQEFYKNSLTPSNSEVAAIWSQAYEYIYYSNSIIEGLNVSNGVTESTKKQLIGEAKIIRAFCHFYLVNLWGDIPLVISTDYRINSTIKRVSKNEIYNQIKDDLIDAQEILPSEYITTERSRPNKWTAVALLARVYLYLEDWPKAESNSSLIIDNNLYELSTNLDEVFLKGSKEAIWQISPVRAPYYTTTDADAFILYSKPQTVALSNDLVNSFALGDKRKTHWIDSIIVDGETFYYPFKYKITSTLNETESNTILRISEQYLIRSEARAKQTKLNEALQDLNIIRSRAGLGGSLAITQQEILLAIESERKRELFTEGHRWIDLKRTNRSTDVLKPIKPDWQETDILFPIPKAQLLNDPSMSDQQNPGY